VIVWENGIFLCSVRKRIRDRLSRWHEKGGEKIRLEKRQVAREIVQEGQVRMLGPCL